MESISSFSQGMSSDISKVIHNNNSYVQALNFRGITTLGNSNGSLVNIKGNEHSITFPILKDCYKLIVTPTGTVGALLAGGITITINGSTTTSLSVDSATTGLDIYNLLKDTEQFKLITWGSLISNTNDKYIK